MKILRVSTALLFAGVFTLAYGSPASAANWDYCGAGPNDYDHGPYGTYAKANQVPMYTGPRSSCQTRAYVNTTTRMDYHCWTMNVYGNTWTYMHLPDFPGVFGWVYDGNLNGGGSGVQCP